MEEGFDLRYRVGTDDTAGEEITDHGTEYETVAAPHCGIEARYFRSAA